MRIHVLARLRIIQINHFQGKNEMFAYHGCTVPAESFLCAARIEKIMQRKKEHFK